MRDVDFFPASQCDPLPCGIACDGKNRSYCMLLTHECAHRQDLESQMTALYGQYLAELQKVNAQCKPCQWKVHQEKTIYQTLFIPFIARIKTNPEQFEPFAEAAACSYYQTQCR